MITCPNCSHQNPIGTEQCEACDTALPRMQNCPNCGAAVQVGAQFCGQCGYGLEQPPVISSNVAENELALPAPQPPNPQLTADEIPTYIRAQRIDSSLESLRKLGNEAPPSPLPHIEHSYSTPPTQIQRQSARLVHLQSNTFIELPQQTQVMHLGKPNGHIPPDIDVGELPHSEVVSRVHADIRVESGHFFIEDVGSSNGTYINSIPLLPGNQHQLQSGDRIALGKGDLVTFLFQLD